MTESVVLHAGVAHHLVPGYFPLAVSNQGDCINVETKRDRRWSRQGSVFQLTHVTKDNGTFCLTLSRALALCFLPVPQRFGKIPVNMLRTYYRRKPEDFEEATDLSLIEWGLKNKCTAVIRNTDTDKVRVYPDFAQASLSISNCSNLIYNLQAFHGNRFVYEHHEVNIYTR